MRKLFRKLHKWLSIPIGVIISITCLTGAILVFQDEILELCYPSRYFVEEIKQEAIPLDKLVPMVNEQLGDSNQVSAVRISPDPQRTYTMTLQEGFRVSAFVNQYTGGITGYHKTRESNFWIVMSLHRWLLDSTRTVGKYIVGTCTLLFVVILITGFILWLPREMKKSRFKIQYRKGIKRLMFDLHNVLGAYACLILLICALSGLMWSFQWYRDGVFTLLGTEAEQRGGGHGRAGGNKEKKQIYTAEWQTVASALTNDNPENEYIRIEDGKAYVHQKYMANSRATDQYIFDKRTGKIKDVILYESQSKSSKIWGWAYSLHVGNYWGIWSKIFTFIAAIIGVSLPVTGYYITIKKRRKRR